MIATMPVGSWTWETMSRRPDDNPVTRCVEQVLECWDMLRALGLTEGDARADVTAQSTSDDMFLVDRKGAHVKAGCAPVDSELSRVLHSVDPTQVEVVTIDLATPGIFLHSGERRHAQKMFVISVDAWSGGAGTVTLHTFSDAWLSHDLRGHKQVAVQRENAPRLRSALSGISRLTQSETVPADPRTYGVPTADGFEDFPDDDADLLDFWHMLEVPRRTRWFLQQLPTGVEHFEVTTESPVNAVQVAAGNQVVGYIWASERDDAAGYEPRTAAGDIALEAGKEWLTRLSIAKGRGLSPSEALRELSSSPGTPSSGMVVPGSLRTFSSLEDLQDLSGRE